MGIWDMASSSISESVSSATASVNNFFKPAEVQSTDATGAPDAYAVYQAKLVAAEKADAKSQTLATALKRQLDVNILRYPNDLFDPSVSNQYADTWIHFAVNVSTDSRLSPPTNTTSNGGDNTQSNPPPKAAGGNGIASQNKSQVASLTSANNVEVMGVDAGSNLLKGKVASAGLDIAVLAGLESGALGIPASRQVKQLVASIALYAPNQFTQAYGADWGNYDALADIIAPEAADALLHGKFGEGAKSAGAAATLTQSTKKDFISVRGGVMANPMKQMQFKGVDFRTFTFTYQFAPRDPDEQKTVNEIIKMFKLHMHPEIKTDSGGMVYLYPSEFEITHMIGDSVNETIGRHTTSVITRVSVDYAPGGKNLTFHDGSPAYIQLSLDFKEMQILDKAKILQGF